MSLFAVEAKKNRSLLALKCFLKNVHIVQMLLYESTPGQQNSLIFLQLFHEGRVWFGDSPSLFNILEGSVQVPAVLLHGVGDHCGGRATHAHFTVNQTLSTSFPLNRDKRETVLDHEIESPRRT